MSDFKRGDRVFIGAEWQREGVVIGDSILGDDFYVVVQHDISDPVVGRQRVQDLTLIPDTVSVTVELPRDEAERLVEEHRVYGERLPPEVCSSPTTAAYRRLRDATAEVLR